MLKLPSKLRNSVKGLINIKNNENKCFLWRHIRHLNLSKILPEIITTADENMVNNLDYEGSIFPVSKKDYFKLNKKSVCINVFCYENDLAHLIHISDQKFKDCMGLLLTTNENKSHYVYIKDFNRFMCKCWICDKLVDAGDHPLGGD